MCDRGPEIRPVGEKPTTVTSDLTPYSLAESMFQDRTDAGRRLGTRLRDRSIEADIVLAIPRGGLPVGRQVADYLGVPLDIVVASKIGAPENPELALGAVAADGTLFANEDLVDRLGVAPEYIESQRQREAEIARRKARTYRNRPQGPDLRDKRVVVVDDGVATGATASASLRQVRESGASRVVLAVPVASPDSIARLDAEADEVIALHTPQNFRAVGQYYREFDQVSDEQAMSYLDDD